MLIRAHHHAKRLSDFGGGFLLSRTLLAHAERLDAARLAGLQQRRLRSIVAYARTHSRFHRERLAGIDLDRFALQDLPTMNKHILMEHFDDIVTDPALNLPVLEAQVQTMWCETYVRGGYRVLPSSGSSGYRGVFVYDRRAWRRILAASLRAASMAGLGVRLPRRRVAMVLAGNPAHLSFLLGASTAVGGIRALHLPASVAFGSLLDPLNAFQPEVLVTYPSVVGFLAQEQQRGRLAIRPKVVTTSAEVLPEPVRRSIRDAWAVEPFNAYASTEGGVMAAECERHRGLHLFEDQLLFEVVDEAHRPVPPGERGKKLLVTNLVNRAQPLIRYELNDILTLSPEPCPCGRPFRLVAEIAGRPQEVFYFRDTAGRYTPVFPVLTVGQPLLVHPRVREFQMIQEIDQLQVNVVPWEPGAGFEREVAAAVAAAIEEAGLQPPPIRVSLLTQLSRDPSKMDKLPTYKRNFEESALAGRDT